MLLAHPPTRAKKNMGEDAVNRMMVYNKAVVPMIIDYKVCKANKCVLAHVYPTHIQWLEFKLEKLPKQFPSIFTELPEEEQKAQFQAGVAFARFRNIAMEGRP